MSSSGAFPLKSALFVDARVIAPADGLVPALIGTKRSINLSIGGNGSWTRGVTNLETLGGHRASMAQ